MANISPFLLLDLLRSIDLDFVFLFRLHKHVQLFHYFQPKIEKEILVFFPSIEIPLFKILRWFILIADILE